MNSMLILKNFTTYLSLRLEPIAGVLLVAGVGWLIIKRMESVILKAFVKMRLDPTLSIFLKNLISIVLKVILFMTVLSMAGVKIASILAVLGAASLALGLSLQSSLSNIAGGVILLAIRPFRVGDVIEIGVFSGKVHAIQIFNTVIKTADNKTIFIPNAKLIGESITNASIESKRRLDITFPVAPNTDIKKAKSLIQEILNKNEDIIRDPEPAVYLGEWGAAGLPIGIRVWCKNADYLTIKQDVIESVKGVFDDNGIQIFVGGG